MSTTDGSILARAVLTSAVTCAAGGNEEVADDEAPADGDAGVDEPLVETVEPAAAFELLLEWSSTRCTTVPLAAAETTTAATVSAAAWRM
ncbi:MAG TPA: hypothetical protein VGD55_02465, partial [Acidothermaceae bacterium]